MLQLFTVIYRGGSATEALYQKVVEADTTKEALERFLETDEDDLGVDVETIGYHNSGWSEAKPGESLLFYVAALGRADGGETAVFAFTAIKPGPKPAIASTLTIDRDASPL